jgi:hypothetical protein
MNARKSLPRGWKRIHGRTHGEPESCEWCGFPDPWSDDDGSSGGYMLHESRRSVTCARKLDERSARAGLGAR